MVKPVVFSDLCKTACEVLDDDYTTKYLIKAKTAKIPLPLTDVGPLVLTIEDEVKGSKGVEGKLTAKFAFQGISFDKVTLKGDKYGVEASKDLSGVKLKVKGDPFDVGGVAVNAEYKTPAAALTAEADKKTISASAVSSSFKYGLFGGSLKYCVKSTDLAYNVGASLIYNGIFGAVVYSSKKVASFAVSYSPLPKLSVAATYASDKKDATVGIKYCDVKPGLSLAAKSTSTTPSAVAVFKLAKDATVVLSATSKYANISAKPTFGLQLTIG